MTNLHKSLIKKLNLSVKRLKEGEDEFWTKNSSPTSLMKTLSKNIDLIICEVWETYNLSKKACLVAIGGFGRGELAPHSDIDLQILIPEKNINNDLDKSISLFVSTLWDVGLEAGHSVRTIEETVSLSKKDTTVATAILELRFLAGKKFLFKELQEARSTEIDSVAFARSKLLEMRQRHSRYQNTPYNLEPNVKESPGGLRDLHTVNWICLEFGFGKNWRQLAFNQLITIEEARQIYRQQKILQLIRGHLHLSAKRREDRLVFDLQSEVAHRMGYFDSKGRRSSEFLMQKYFRAAKLVCQISEMILANLEPKLFPNLDEKKLKNPSKISFYIKTNKINSMNNKIKVNFIEDRGFLSLKENTEIHNHPILILKLFHVFQTYPQIRALSPKTIRLIWNSRNLIDTEFTKSKINQELFLKILKEPKLVAKTLKLMIDLGILSKILPVFQNIVGQMQHDLFHVYTVDQHTLHVIRNIERYTQQEHAHEFPKCSELMSNFVGHWKLYIAALFHDIAKGRGGDHSQLGAKDVKNFSKDFNIKKSDSELIEFLVQEHLTMSLIAQKKDIEDPRTINDFTEKVKTKEKLTALYLLTVADIRGTSPKVWNNWKGKLLEKLFDSTLKKILDGKIYKNKLNSPYCLHDTNKKDFNSKHNILLNTKKYKKFFDSMHISYFLKHDPVDVEWHAEVLCNTINTSIPIVKAKFDMDVNGIKLIVYKMTRENLFARIVEYFDSNSYSVLDAKINTTKHGFALNTFLLNQKIYMENPEDNIKLIEKGLFEHLKIETEISLSLSGRKSRRSRFFPITPTVELSADEKNEFHILSLTAGDRPGLLFKIAKVLQNHKISVQTARISTLGERVEDVFVVESHNLNSEKKSIELESDLLSTLEA